MKKDKDPSFDDRQKYKDELGQFLKFLKLPRVVAKIEPAPVLALDEARENQRPLAAAASEKARPNRWVARPKRGVPRLAGHRVREQRAQHPQGPQ